jgi:hypothetical protein
LKNWILQFYRRLFLEVLGEKNSCLKTLQAPSKLQVLPSTTFSSPLAKKNPQIADQLARVAFAIRGFSREKRIADRTPIGTALRSAICCFFGKTPIPNPRPIGRA